MNIDEAVSKLRKMQSQIIHGRNIFGDIADNIESILHQLTQLQSSLSQRELQLKEVLDLVLGDTHGANAIHEVAKKMAEMQAAMRVKDEALNSVGDFIMQQTDAPWHKEIAYSCKKALTTTPSAALDEVVRKARVEELVNVPGIYGSLEYISKRIAELKESK